MSEPTINSLILDKIQDLREHVNDRFDAAEESARATAAAQNERLDRIEAQTTKTNGRVTVLENARARAGGMVAAYKWVPVAATTLLGSGMTILIMALAGQFH